MMLDPALPETAPTSKDIFSCRGRGDVTTGLYLQSSVPIVLEPTTVIKHVDDVRIFKMKHLEVGCNVQKQTCVCLV